MSPGGQWLAYTVQDPKRTLQVNSAKWFFNEQGTMSGMSGTDVWIVNVKSGELRNLTKGAGSNWSPVWSPDGKQLAFYSDRKGRANLWIYELSGGLRRVSDVVVRPSPNFAPFGDVVRWTTDSKKVLCKVLSEGDPIALASGVGASSDRQTWTQTNESLPTVTVYRSVPGESDLTEFRGNSGIVQDPFTNANHADLALIEISGGRVERIAHNFNVGWYGFSPDGSCIAFVSARGQVGGNNRRWLLDLFIILSGHSPRPLANDIPEWGPSVSVSWSPDGEWLSYRTTGPGTNGECYIVSVREGVPRKATDGKHPSFAGGIDAPVWTNDGKSLYVVADYRDVWKMSLADGIASIAFQIPRRRVHRILGPEGRYWSPDGGRSMVVQTENDDTAQAGFFKVDSITGQYTKLLEENGAYSLAQEFSVPPNRHELVLNVQDLGHPPDLWIAGLDFQSPRQVTHLNQAFDHYKMGKGQVVKWRSLDGQRLRGALLLPADYDGKRKYPLVVRVYPNYPAVALLNTFQRGEQNVQLLTTRGYAVLIPEAPLGHGTGSEMRDLAKTVLPGVNKVVEIGIADPDRIGIMGASWGGYAVLSLIVQTSLFKAAVMHAGFGNVLGMYAEMSEDGSTPGLGIVEVDDTGGTPWEVRDRFIEDSPVFYLDRVQTPLLITHGDFDSLVSPFLADEVFVDLRRLGKEVEYAKYHGEGHSIAGYSNEIDWLNRIINWFEKRLKEGVQQQSPSLSQPVKVR